MAKNKLFTFTIIGVCFGNIITFRNNLNSLLDDLDVQPYRIITVDNSLPVDSPTGWNTNSAFEFSGYLNGLYSFLKSTKFDSDHTLIFLNDTIFKSHSKKCVQFYFMSILSTLFNSSHAYTGVHSQLPCTLSKYTGSNYYISTFLLGVRTDHNSLMHLCSSLCFPLSDSYITLYLDLFNSTDYAKFISSWLLRPGVLSGWYGASPLTSLSSNTINRKKMTIAREFLLPSIFHDQKLQYLSINSSIISAFYRLFDRLFTLSLKIRSRYFLPFLQLLKKLFSLK